MTYPSYYKHHLRDFYLAIYLPYSNMTIEIGDKYVKVQKIEYGQSLSEDVLDMSYESITEQKFNEIKAEALKRIAEAQ